MPRSILDPTVWQRLVRSVGGAIGDRNEAEDLLQSAFVKLEEYRQRVSVENEAAFLHRAAVNLAIDERRSARVRCAQTGRHDLEAIWDGCAPQDEILIVQERLRKVRAGLHRLSPRTREIFLMHRLDGLKHPEIAVRLGISVSAVEKHIARAALFLTEWIAAE